MSRQTNDSELRWFIRRNLAVILFLVAASGGLYFLYQDFIAAEQRPFTVQEGGQSAESVDGLAPQIGEEGYVAVGNVGQQFVQSPGPLKIAIVVGHRASDAGAVCDDGLQEVMINESVAQRVLVELESEGLPVSLLSEFDARLNGFSSDLLVSLHSDSCTPLDPSFTGYKTTVNQSPQSPQLKACIEQNYAQQTGLPIHPTTITDDMIFYHAFNKVSAESPAILLEMGFMYNDRELLTTNSDAVVQGVVNGILCYLQSQS